jgi:hypothetical protein
MAVQTLAVAVVVVEPTHQTVSTQILAVVMVALELLLSATQLLVSLVATTQ